MDFDLTAQQKSLQDMVRKFVENEVIPVVNTPDKEKDFLWDAWEKMGELGLLGMCVPEEYGGAGTDNIMFALAIEEIARGHASLALSMAPHNCFVGDTISQHGTKEQKETYLPGLASGKLIGAGGWTEPGAGSDVHGIKTTAVKDGDYYIVNGSKTFITNAPIAHVLITLVVTDKSTKPPGLTCLIIDRESQGISFGKPLDKMGLCGSPTGEIFFEDCKVPVGNLLGRENKGFTQLMSTFEIGRYGPPGSALCWNGHCLV